VKIKKIGSRLVKTMAPGSRSRKFWLVGGLIALSIGGFGIYKGFTGGNNFTTPVITGTIQKINQWFNSSDELTYLTNPVTKGTISDMVQATGTLEPLRKVELSFKNVETINVLNVQAGDKVEEGQVLAEQDTRDLNAQLKQAERDISQNEAQLQKLVIANKKALKTLNQQQELLAAGVIAQDELDLANDDYLKSQIDIESSQAQLENSKAKLDMVLNDLNATKLVTPFSGIASQVNGDVGQRSGGGNGTGVNAFITVISEDLQLKALVNEVDIGRVILGQDVEFTSTAYSGKTFLGKVLKISTEATTVSNVQFYQVLISCTDPQHLLHPGMSTAVNIISARKNEVLTVPMMALTYAESYSRNNTKASIAGKTKGETNPVGEGTAKEDTAKPINRTNEANQKAIVILEEDKPVLKLVEVGLSDGQNIEIVGGLNPGDKVVIGTNQYATSTSNSTSTSTSTMSNSNRSGNMMPRGPGF